MISPVTDPFDALNFFNAELGPDGEGGHDLGLAADSDGIHRDTDYEQEVLTAMRRDESEILLNQPRATFVGRKKGSPRFTRADRKLLECR